VKHFKEAAEQGNAIGQFNYGICYYKGEGLCVDFAEAFEYFKQSSDQNYPPAHVAVGFCLYLGRGISRDIFFSRRYFSLAAESGMVIDNEWDQLQRIENPMEVLSLSAPLLESDKISLSLATCEQSYFGRVDPWSGMEDDASKRRNRKTRSRINTTNRADWPINLDALREVKELGSGTCGVVKLMEDEDGEQYAVKFFTGSWHRTAEMAAAAFSHEFDACCKLRHPCIVPVYGFSAATERNEAALVTKYMENGSLSDVLRRVKAGNPPSFWTPTGIGIIVVGFVCGLEFIHSKGFVHRDLKPSNLLIDKDGRCYVGDLGSARLLEGATPLSGVKSTILYTAPELYDGKYNWKVDIFSFALVLYEILVGRAVYEGYSEERTMFLAITGVRAELPPGMSADVKSLITRCWSDDPEKRPSFKDILIDLEGISFKLLPGVNYGEVKRFLNEVRSQETKK
jgi:hypothetical protein